MLGGWQKPNLFIQKEQGLFFFWVGKGGGGYFTFWAIELFWGLVLA